MILHSTAHCCVDCLLYIANGDISDERPDIAAEIAAEWGEGFHLVPGDSENDHEFSWSPCGACGSRLGGSRHEFHVLTCEAV